jgi:hypothetical protein
MLQEQFRDPLPASSKDAVWPFPTMSRPPARREPGSVE